MPLFVVVVISSIVLHTFRWYFPTSSFQSTSIYVYGTAAESSVRLRLVGSGLGRSFTDVSAAINKINHFAKWHLIQWRLLMTTRCRLRHTHTHTNHHSLMAASLNSGRFSQLFSHYSNINCEICAWLIDGYVVGKPSAAETRVCVVWNNEGAPAEAIGAIEFDAARQKELIAINTLPMGSGHDTTIHLDKCPVWVQFAFCICPFDVFIKSVSTNQHTIPSHSKLIYPN